MNCDEVLTKDCWVVCLKGILPDFESNIGTISDVACRTGFIYLFFNFSGEQRQARGMYDGRDAKKNNACPHTIFHAVPSPDTSPNLQLITASGMDVLCEYRSNPP